MRRGSDGDREAETEAETEAAAAKESEAEAVQGWAEAQFVATLSSTLPQSSHTHTLAYTVVHKESKRKRATHKRQKSNLRCSDKSSKPACCSAAALLLPSLTVYLVR